MTNDEIKTQSPVEDTPPSNTDETITINEPNLLETEDTSKEAKPSFLMDIGGYIAIFLISQIVGGVFAVILAFAISPTEMAEIFTNTDGAAGGRQVPLMIIQTGALISFVFVFMWFKRLTGLSFHKNRFNSFMKPTSFATLFGVSLGGFVVIILFQSGLALVITEILNQAPIVDTNPMRAFPEEGAGIGFMLLLVLNLVILAPVAEEVIFRGFILSALRERMGNLAAISIAAGLFAAIHFDPKVFIPLFFIGWICGFAAVQCRSVMPAIGIHLVNNLSVAIYTLAMISTSSGTT